VEAEKATLGHKAVVPKMVELVVELVVEVLQEAVELELQHKVTMVEQFHQPITKLVVEVVVPEQLEHQELLQVQVVLEEMVELE
jgi:hypothetical protein